MATLLELARRALSPRLPHDPTDAPWVGPLAPDTREEAARFRRHGEAERAANREKERAGKETRETRPDTSSVLPLREYDTIAVTFSGGKDSLACLLTVLERCRAEGVPTSKVELWHHAVDGRPGSEPVFDWPCTESYCEAVAAEFKIPLYYSWREHGILGEMQLEDRVSHDVVFQSPVPGGGVREIRVPPTDRAKPHTRRLLDARGERVGTPAWPPVSGDLSKRWCSSLVKVDVGRRILTNDPRFKRDCKVLVISGERREESTGRSYYARVEEEKGSTAQRRVDRWRPVIEWTTEEVWGIIQRWGVTPHPCYWLGFGRASCETCIFSGPREWATIREIHPERYALFNRLERWARATIDPAGLSIGARVEGHYEERGRAPNKVKTWFPAAESLAPGGAVGAYWRGQSQRFTAPLRVAPGAWFMPAGGGREGAGPT